MSLLDALALVAPSALAALPAAGPTTGVVFAGLATVAGLLVVTGRRVLYRTRAGNAFRVHASNTFYLPLLAAQFAASRREPVRPSRRSIQRPAGGRSMKHLEFSSSHRTESAPLITAPTPAQNALRTAIASTSVFLPRSALEPMPDLAFSEAAFEHTLRRGLRCGSVDKAAMSATLKRAYAAGAYDARDLLAASSLRGVDENVSLDVLQAYLEGSIPAASQVVSAFPSCAAVAAEVSDQPWPVHVRERITHWARRFLTTESSFLASPFRNQAPLQAWLAEMEIDCSDTVLGLRSTQGSLLNFSNSPEELVNQAALRLRVPDALLAPYFETLLAEAIACLPEASEEACVSPGFLDHLLAIRLSWELLLLEEFAMEGAELAWRRVLQVERRRHEGTLDPAHEDELLLTIQAAYEHGEHRHLTVGITGGLRAQTPYYDVSADRDLSTLESLLTETLIRRSATALGQKCPARAAAFVPAPITAINAILERHEGLRRLVDNGWVHLFAAYDDGAVIVRYDGNLHWAPATVQDVA